VLQNELEMMSKLKHPNLVNLVGIREDCQYTKKDGRTYSCLAIVLEYAEGGELFEFLARTGRLGAEVARTLMAQLVEGLAHIHGQGVSHRDIKPENILLDGEFRPKIADFGFACLSEGKDGSGILHTSLGTEGYKAPEVSSRHYSGEKADIFSLGVVLFVMYAGSPPFEKADPRDYYYKMHVNKKQEAFWASHSKRRPIGFFSPAFIDLLNKMFAYKPEERPTLAEIRAHDWMQQDVLMQPDLIKQLT
jgi:serine/threonine protein kinase